MIKTHRVSYETHFENYSGLGGCCACWVYQSDAGWLVSGAWTEYSLTTEVKKLLWVGSSFFYYNNSMRGHVVRLLTSAGGKGYRAVSVTISGSGLSWYDVKSHFELDAVRRYSFVGDNEVCLHSTRTAQKEV